MIRTQIQLTEKQAESLKSEAARQGISMAELIRRCVDRFVERAGEPSPRELRSRAASISGKFRSGNRDVSVRHDEYLARALKE